MEYHNKPTFSSFRILLNCILWFQLSTRNLLDDIGIYISQSIVLFSLFEKKMAFLANIRRYPDFTYCPNFNHCRREVYIAGKVDELRMGFWVAINRSL